MARTELSRTRTNALFAEVSPTILTAFVRYLLLRHSGARISACALSLRTVAARDEKHTRALCADAHGFSLHAGVRCGTHQRKEPEPLCRYITRPAIAIERQLWSERYDRSGSIPVIRPAR